MPEIIMKFFDDGWSLYFHEVENYPEGFHPYDPAHDNLKIYVNNIELEGTQLEKFLPQLVQRHMVINPRVWLALRPKHETNLSITSYRDNENFKIEGLENWKHKILDISEHLSEKIWIKSTEVTQWSDYYSLLGDTIKPLVESSRMAPYFEYMFHGYIFLKADLISELDSEIKERFQKNPKLTIPEFFAGITKASSKILTTYAITKTPQFNALIETLAHELIPYFTHGEGFKLLQIWAPRLAVALPEGLALGLATAAAGYVVGDLINSNYNVLWEYLPEYKAAEPESKYLPLILETLNKSTNTPEPKLTNPEIKALVDKTMLRLFSSSTAEFSLQKILNNVEEIMMHFSPSMSSNENNPSPPETSKTDAIKEIQKHFQEDLTRKYNPVYFSLITPPSPYKDEPATPTTSHVSLGYENGKWRSEVMIDPMEHPILAMAAVAYKILAPEIQNYFSSEQKIALNQFNSNLENLQTAEKEEWFSTLRARHPLSSWDEIRRLTKKELFAAIKGVIKTHSNNPQMVAVYRSLHFNLAHYGTLDRSIDVSEVQIKAENSLKQGLQDFYGYLEKEDVIKAKEIIHKLHFEHHYDARVALAEGDYYLANKDFHRINHTMHRAMHQIDFEKNLASHLPNYYQEEPGKLLHFINLQEKQLQYVTYLKNQLSLQKHHALFLEYAENRQNGIFQKLQAYNQECLLQAPSNISYLSFRRDIHRLQDKLSLAIADQAEICEIAPGKKNYEKLLQLYEETGDLVNVNHIYKKILEYANSKESISILVTMKDNFNQLQQINEAYTVSKDIIKHTLARSEDFIEHGKFCLRLAKITDEITDSNKISEATAALEKYFSKTSKEPESANQEQQSEAFCVLAQIHFANNNVQEFRKNLQLALSSNEKNLEAQCLYAEELSRNHNWFKAEEIIKNALAQNPNDQNARNLAESIANQRYEALWSFFGEIGFYAISSGFQYLIDQKIPKEKAAMAASTFQTSLRAYATAQKFSPGFPLQRKDLKVSHVSLPLALIVSAMDTFNVYSSGSLDQWFEKQTHRKWRDISDFATPALDLLPLADLWGVDFSGRPFFELFGDFANLAAVSLTIVGQARNIEKLIYGIGKIYTGREITRIENIDFHRFKNTMMVSARIGGMTATHGATLQLLGTQVWHITVEGVKTVYTAIPLPIPVPPEIIAAAGLTVAAGMLTYKTYNAINEYIETTSKGDAFNALYINACQQVEVDPDVSIAKLKGCYSLSSNTERHHDLDDKVMKISKYRLELSLQTINRDITDPSTRFLKTLQSYQTHLQETSYLSPQNSQSLFQELMRDGIAMVETDAEMSLLNLRKCLELNSHEDVQEKIQKMIWNISKYQMIKSLQEIEAEKNSPHYFLRMISVYKKHITQCPDDLDAKIVLETLSLHQEFKELQNNHQYQDSLIVLDQLIAKNPSSSELIDQRLLTQLKIFEQSNDFYEGIKYYSSYLQVDPKSAVALQCRARLFTKAKQPEMAKQDLYHAKDLMSWDPSTYLHLAAIEAQEKNIPAARKLAQKAYEAALNQMADFIYEPAHDEQRQICQYHIDQSKQFLQTLDDHKTHMRAQVMGQSLSSVLYALGNYLATPMPEAETLQQDILPYPNFHQASTPVSSTPNFFRKQNGCSIPNESEKEFSHLQQFWKNDENQVNDLQFFERDFYNEQQQDLLLSQFWHKTESQNTESHDFREDQYNFLIDKNI